jgi:hypothetical protein
MVDQEILKTSLKKAVGLIFAGLMLSGCGDNGVQPDNSPALSNLSGYQGKTIVAYDTPDPLEKVDTVQLSFDFNPSKIKSVRISVTMDSGKISGIIADKTLDNSKKASLVWIPKNDSITFGYCGKKIANIRISDINSNEMIISDTFTIIGSVPYMLTSPKSHDSYHLTDSIPILYTQNQDLSSNVTVGVIFAGDTGNDFTGVNTSPIKLSQSLPIKNFLKKLFPQNFSSQAGNYAHPITIFIRDYGSSTYIARADSISITP